jgi:hypothetical protein
MALVAAYLACFKDWKVHGAVIVDDPQTDGLDFGAELQLIVGPRSRPRATVKVGVGNFGQSTDVVADGL